MQLNGTFFEKPFFKQKSFREPFLCDTVLAMRLHLPEGICTGREPICPRFCLFLPYKIARSVYKRLWQSWVVITCSVASLCIRLKSRRLRSNFAFSKIDVL